MLPYLLDRYELCHPPAVAAELLEQFPCGEEFCRLKHAGELEQVAPAAAQGRELAAIQTVSALLIASALAQLADWMTQAHSR